MAKFLNKKEQVYDIELTTYGRHLLSKGTFKPVYYAFYDNNIIYDKKYTNSASAENQSIIHNRIKNDTQYIESLTLFRDLDETLNGFRGGTAGTYDQPREIDRASLPESDIFKIDGSISDVNSGAEIDRAPAWKVVSIQSRIVSTQNRDSANNSLIPQINIESTYVKRIKNNTLDFDPTSFRRVGDKTAVFSDGKVIQIEHQDPFYYVEELNTILLTENFEIEVYEILDVSGDNTPQQLNRKYFRRNSPQVQNGFLVSETPDRLSDTELSADSVEYYFDVLTDRNSDRKIACRATTDFSKESYYIDLDFDCRDKRGDSLFYDIYGTVTEPEICQT